MIPLALDSDSVITYLNAVHQYAAFQDDILKAEADKIFQIL
jgi:hypothetical protein